MNYGKFGSGITKQSYDWKILVTQPPILQLLVIVFLSKAFFIFDYSSTSSAVVK